MLTVLSYQKYHKRIRENPLRIASSSLPLPFSLSFSFSSFGRGMAALSSAYASPSYSSFLSFSYVYPCFLRSAFVCSHRPFRARRQSLSNSHAAAGKDEQVDRPIEKEEIFFCLFFCLCRFNFHTSKKSRSLLVNCVKPVSLMGCRWKGFLRRGFQGEGRTRRRTCHLTVVEEMQDGRSLSLSRLCLSRLLRRKETRARFMILKISRHVKVHVYF